MKATAKLLVTALAAAGLGLAAADSFAARGGGGGHGGHGGGGGYRGASSGHGGHGGHYGGRHYGGHRGYYGHSHRYYGGYWGWPSYAWYWGVPVAVGLGYAYGYYGGYYNPYYWGYPQEPYTYSVPQQGIPTVPVEPPRSNSNPAPTSGPVYMNYCESAREYYPAVRTCPEGWKFVTPTT